MKTLRTSPINQNETVITTLRSIRKGLTSEEICNTVNKGLKNPKQRLTVTQVSKCLNRFREKGLVKKLDTTTKNSNGRQVNKWMYSPKKS